MPPFATGCDRTILKKNSVSSRTLSEERGPSSKRASFRNEVDILEFNVKEKIKVRNSLVSYKGKLARDISIEGVDRDETRDDLGRKKLALIETAEPSDLATGE